MKTAGLLLLLLSFTACKRDFYAVATIDPLPVGHVIRESDLVKGRIGPTRFLDSQFTTDASDVVGRTVIHAVPKNSFIHYRRDLQ